MNKSKLLIVAVVVLAALNLGLMWLLLKRPAHSGESNRTIIIERLNFDDAQTKVYDELVTMHQKDVRLHEDSLRQCKNVLYAQALAQRDSVLANELVAKISNIQTSIEWIHYRHFEDIQSICRPEQVSAFNELTNELAAMFNARKPHPKGPKP
jgi:periplasmic protein CpxP/Spy